MKNGIHPQYHTVIFHDTAANHSFLTRSSIDTKGRLETVEEFEKRVDLAHKAESSDELRKLLQDLPTGDLPIRRDEVSLTHPPRAEATTPSSRVKERGLMVAALGGVERKGRWIPARTSYAIALMGGLSLDFREALLPPGETEVWIFTLMGGAEIIVPPGLRVRRELFIVSSDSVAAMTAS